jgi:hypothetical protein
MRLRRQLGTLRNRQRQLRELRGWRRRPLPDEGNTLSLCCYTPSHLGWMPQLLIRNYGYLEGAGESINIRDSSVT